MLVLSMLVSLAMIMVVVSSLLPTLHDLIDRQRAQSAADAAALAGLDGGASDAAHLASMHGGELVSWSEQGAVVTVRVQVGDQVAVARATDGP